jgi:glycerol-3-phosphate acyltransferase PlsY
MIFGINSWIPYLCLILAVLGHNYSIFLKFKGGKGVSSTLGGYFALRPLLGIIFLIVWIPVELATKYVSLASLLGLFISAIMGFFIDLKSGITFLILFLFSAYKHRSNIKRLIDGTENKTDFLDMIKRGNLKSE